MVQRKAKGGRTAVNEASQAAGSAASEGALHGKSFSKTMSALAREVEKGAGKLHPITSQELKAAREAVRRHLKK